MKFPRNSKIPKTRIPIFVSHPHFLGATFFASHLLVAKFLGVGGIFILGNSKFLGFLLGILVFILGIL